MNRRTLFQAGAAAALTFAGRKLVRAAGTPSKARPRFYLQIIPDGGMDPMYSLDPKTARDVEPDIDAPHASRAIIDAAGLRLAPSFAALAKWAPRLSTINAIRQNSANHIAGLIHTTRCKSRSSLSTPALFDILGTRRGTEAVGAVNLNTTFDSAFSPKFLGQPSTFGFGTEPGLFDHLDAASSDELADVAVVLEREGRALATRPGAAVSAENMHEAAALFGRAATSPRFQPVEWKLGAAQERETMLGSGKELQRALWLFEHELARCVVVSVGMQSYDTHIWNPVFQPSLTQYLANLLDRTLEELDRRKVGGVSLAEQTVVIVGSEIGRFPRLNVARGKDHFPQVPYLVFGKWFASGTFGATDRQMIARPISLSRGTPEVGGHLLTVDDLGTTLLAIDGANPELYGYTGEHLAFLTG